MRVLDGPQQINKHGDILENVIIITQPGEDTALQVANKRGVTIRNVLIYHPANGRGIYAWKTPNLHIENVEVVAYGNDFGAQPCPSRAPLNGFQCNNIQVYHSPGLVIHNVRVENGSKGISVIGSDAAWLKNVAAFNARGPYPAG